MEVLVGNAVAGGGSFRPIAAALADRLRQRPGSVDQSGAGRSDLSLLDEEGLRPFRSALNRLVPVLAGEVATLGPIVDSTVDVDPIVVLGEGVLRLLGLLAADRGCVLLLEDLHWADADTVALVEYLAGGRRVDRGVARGLGP